MTIEKRPDKGRNNFGFLKKVVHALAQKRIEQIGKPPERVLYNEDETRRFIIYQVGKSEDEAAYQVTALDFQIGAGWVQAFELHRKLSSNEVEYVSLSIGTINEEPRTLASVFYLERDGSRGSRHRGTRILGVSDDQIDVFFQNSNFLSFDQLPEFIDFEKTGQGFMDQLKNGNFSYPKLYPKELLR